MGCYVSEKTKRNALRWQSPYEEFCVRANDNVVNNFTKPLLYIVLLTMSRAYYVKCTETYSVTCSITHVTQCPQCFMTWLVKPLISVIIHKQIITEYSVRYSHLLMPSTYQEVRTHRSTEYCKLIC